MSRNTIYLVTGGNRGPPHFYPYLTLPYLTPIPTPLANTQAKTPGIGLHLAAALLLRPHTTVIATLRSEETSQEALHALPAGENSKLVITYLDLSPSTPIPDPETETNSENTPQTQPHTHTPQSLHHALTKTHHIPYINTIIASAGHGTSFRSLLSTPPSSLLQNFHINTLGPITLFQALYPLLEAGTGNGNGESKFVLISSSLGSIDAMGMQAGTEPTPTLAYGVSKAGANYFCRKVHFECEGVTALAVHPGWVKTANGQAFADAVGIKEPPMSLEDSVKGVLKQIDTASKSTTSGTFMSYDGTVIPW
ncbi:Norsolorinic acid ketoreductase [Lachnellula arida]|uniref:Norsolorinic acid ketoreductase n=1 Tax=Lachnellula arida TaxID=1316785 RepID=A0A8T9BDN9_9HELO|nr:Norsolorinic acid ketoreductase [Lachnellula arida]